MADINYISPGALLPKTDLPGLGGFMLGEQQKDYRNMMSLQNLLGLMGAEKQSVELGELYKDLPKREAERELAITKAKTDTGTYPKIEGMKVENTELDLGKKKALQPSEILKEQEKNRTAISGERIKQSDQALENLITFKTNIRDAGPAWRELFDEQATSAGMGGDSQIYKYLASSKDPEELNTKLSKIENHLFMKNKELRKEWMQQTGADYRAELLRNTQREIAGINADARRAAAKGPQDPKTYQALATRALQQAELAKEAGDMAAYEQWMRIHKDAVARDLESRAVGAGVKAGTTSEILNSPNPNPAAAAQRATQPQPLPSQQGQTSQGGRRFVWNPQTQRLEAK